MSTVKDFSIIFDALVKVEEGTLLALMQGGASHDSAEVEERMNKIEAVLERRPVLLNSVLLRQSPHNVHEWLKRVELMKQEVEKEAESSKHEGKGKACPDKILQTYVDALAAVDQSKAVGRVSSLWCGLANYHEKRDEIDKARQIWKKASKAALHNTEERAIIVCAWAEMEMRLERYSEAHEVVRKALYEAKQEENSLCVRNNAKVWALYLDLEESLGTNATCRAAYDEAMSRKAITANMCLNYAAYLEEANFSKIVSRSMSVAWTCLPFRRLRSFGFGILRSFSKDMAVARWSECVIYLSKALKMHPRWTWQSCILSMRKQRRSMVRHDGQLPCTIVRLRLCQARAS